MTDYDAIEFIAYEFREQRGPFEDTDFPERVLVEELGDEFAPEYLSVFVQWDYNRSVDNLVANIIELYEQYGPEFFIPSYVVEKGEEYVREATHDVTTRYPNRDATGYYDNARILKEHYSGSWRKLIQASDYDAVKLVDLLNMEDFKYLSGDKLAPFYARVMHDEYHEMDNIWQVAIPVDTHIRRLSKDLFGDLTDDEIRERWSQVADETGISPHVVDGALWKIGYGWDEWGEDYWNEVRQS